MSRPITSIVSPLMVSMALATATSAAWANPDEIRSNCEYDVQAYGIVDENEYKQALQDCIDSYTQEMQYSEQGEAENPQDTESNQ